MSIELEAEYPGRTNAGDASYPHGSFKNETVPGTSDDGTPLESAWQNDHEGTRQALLLAAAITPTGNPDTATDSDVMNAMKVVLGGAGLYQADVNYSATRNDYTKGTDGNLYRCGADNGPGSTPVDPVGDLTGAWVSAGSVNVVTLSVSGAYNRPDNLVCASVSAQGAGGGGGASTSTTLNGGSCGASGGGGGHIAGLFSRSELSASETIIIGAAGVGGTSSGSIGSAGGDTVFGSLLSGLGGGGGSGASFESAVPSRGSSPSGDGGATTGTGVSVGGKGGSIGSIYGGGLAISAEGGDSFLGHGGSVTSEGGGGRPGVGFGGGGAGGVSGSQGGTDVFRSGGNGSPGVIIITEYLG